VDQEKYNLIEGLKLVHQEGCSSISHVDNIISSKALIASYIIFNLIAKHSKSFTEGQFVKECHIAAVQSFKESLTLQEAANIPLSDNKFSYKLYCFFLTRKIKIFIRILLRLDESTDSRHVSQLNSFGRIMQSDFSRSF